jgi:hypothetical protein
MSIAIVPKGSHMWRFLLAGLGTVGGLALLFLGSFGDPTTILPDLHPASHVGPTPVEPKPVQSAAPALLPAEAPATGSPASATPAMGTDANVAQRQHDALQQLQQLEARLAQATQDTAALRAQADQARRELDDLRQQRAEDQAAALEQVKLQAQREAEASRRRAAEQPKTEQQGNAATEQQGKGTAVATASQQSQRVEPPAEVRVLPVPDPVSVVSPPGPAQPSARPGSAEPEVRQIQQRPRPDAQPEVKVLPPARPPVPAPPRSTQATVKPAPAEPDAREAVLTRLRRESPPRSDASSRADALSRGVNVQVASDQTRITSPRQRLMDARSALAAGRTDDARQLLEQAQVQLVFRPVNPSQDASASGSVAAGQVAEALSMLGAGDVLHAIRYINLAVAQADQGPTFAPAAPQPVTRPPQPQRFGDDYYYNSR